MPENPPVYLLTAQLPLGRPGMHGARIGSGFLSSGPLAAPALLLLVPKKRAAAQTVMPDGRFPSTLEFQGDKKNRQGAKKKQFLA